MGVRGTKAEPVEGEHLLYSFLTSEPNGIVGPIHPKAMPVILTTTEEYEVWLSASADEALKLQRPLPDDLLEIVAEGARSDQPEGGDTAGSRSA
jgi:putative SOS response-associated peptidase YedK